MLCAAIVAACMWSMQKQNYKLTTQSNDSLMSQNTVTTINVSVQILDVVGYHIISVDSCPVRINLNKFLLCLVENNNKTYSSFINGRGPVVRKLINANPWLKVNQCSNFSWMNVLSLSMFSGVWHQLSLKPKLKDKKFKKKLHWKVAKLK